MKMTIDPQKPGEIRVRAGKKREPQRHEEIAQLAYQFYEQDGRAEGKDLEHWLKAEEKIHKPSKTTD